MPSPSNETQLLKFNYSTEKQFPKIVDLREDETTHEVYAKAFLIDESVNKNFWNISNASMEKYSTGFISRPLIMHPSGNHPDYLKEGVAANSSTFIEDVLRVQDNFKVGEIIDVRREDKNTDRKNPWYAYIKLTDPKFISKLKSGAVSFYVSPQVYDVNENAGNGAISEFVPLHLAVVKEPAYGDVARIKGICDGTGPVCLNALKSAAENFIRHDSSFFENLGSKDYKLTNKLIDENQSPTTNPNYPYPNNNSSVPVAGDSNTQQVQGQQAAPQAAPTPIAQRMSVETETEDGKVIKRTEDQRTKNINKKEPDINLQTPSTSDINTPVIPTANPADPNVPRPEVQLPKEIMDALGVVNQWKQDKANNDKELADLKQFKQKYEEERTMKAAEEQRGLIEGFFTEAVIADPTAREEMVAFFANLNLTNDQLSKVLDLVVSGGFQSASVDKDGKKVTKNHKVKSANYMTEASAIMDTAYQTRGYRNNSVIREGLFGSINLENL